VLSQSSSWTRIQKEKSWCSCWDSGLHHSDGFVQLIFEIDKCKPFKWIIDILLSI
jgi:hypothetical protein